MLTYEKILVNNVIYRLGTLAMTKYRM